MTLYNQQRVNRGMIQAMLVEKSNEECCNEAMTILQITKLVYLMISSPLHNSLSTVEHRISLKKA